MREDKKTMDVLNKNKNKNKIYWDVLSVNESEI